MAVDSKENVLVLLVSSGLSNGVFVLKYTAADGALLWKRARTVRLGQ
jgi:hypothetical protein